MSLIFNVLMTFLRIMEFAIVIRALLSWVDPSMGNPISQFLVQLTEPIIGPIRRAIPSIGMIDISPMVAILVIFLLQQMLSRAMIAS